MVRKTLKYQRAIEIMPDISHSSSDELYQYLINNGYYWDSNCSRWIYAPGEHNNPPSITTKIRVWADKNRVSDIADKIAEIAGDAGLRQIEKSAIYPCRPPQSNDARIYLTFE